MSALISRQEIRLRGQNNLMLAEISNFTPQTDSEAYEKTLWLTSLDLNQEALAFSSAYKWTEEIEKSAALSIANITNRKFDLALEYGKTAFELSQTANDVVYKLPYLIALNLTNQAQYAYELIVNDLNKVPSNDSLFNITVSEICSSINKFDEAYKFSLRCLAITVTNPRAFRVLGICEFMSGDYNAAIGYASKAFNLIPNASIGALYMACKSSLGDPIGAIATSKKIKGPFNFDVFEQLGAANVMLGNMQEAECNYLKALEINDKAKLSVKGLITIYSELRRHYDVESIEKKYSELILSDYEACTSLGYHYLNMGNKLKSFDYFRLATINSVNNPTIDNRLTWPISEPRLRHDRDQLLLLKSRGRANESSEKALNILNDYEKLLGDKNSSFSPENPELRTRLIQAIGSYHSIPDIPFEGRALGENNYSSIENDFLTKKTKIVVIDNFLSESALLNLRQFCEEANIWKRTYHNGYHGAFMGTGFCSRVMLAIADELKIAMPKVVGPNLLKQAWGFKYDQRMTGINLHADFAKVNTNFWITPDEACEDNTKGGIVVYDVPAPDYWSFMDYNAETEKIEEFLKQNNAKSIHIPYKMNRCVLFDSTYFHATDEIYFKDGYENRRINCTLLYGQGLRNR